MTCPSPPCPIPDPTRHLPDVAGFTLPADTTLSRGHGTRHGPATFPPAGHGRPARFSPLSGVAHAYVARLPTAAVLETALRDVGSGDRTVYAPQLRPWQVSPVVTTTPLRLADLRQPALADLGLTPGQLTTAGPAHYPCTGRWAATLHSAQFDGVWWHSRQASLYDEARQSGGLAEVLLTHAAIEVGVIWAPPAALACLRPGDGAPTLLHGAQPDRLVLELAALLGLVVEAG